MTDSHKGLSRSTVFLNYYKDDLGHVIREEGGRYNKRFAEFQKSVEHCKKLLPGSICSVFSLNGLLN